MGNEMLGHLMLYSGLAVMVVAVVAAVLIALWLHFAENRLNKTLAEEYGRKRC